MQRDPRRPAPLARQRQAGRNKVMSCCHPYLRDQHALSSVAQSGPRARRTLLLSRDRARGTLVALALSVALVDGCADSSAPSHPDYSAGVPQRTSLGARIEGLAAISDAQLKLLGLPEGSGVVVTYVCAAGPAHKAGLKPGDVIRVFAGTPVTDRPTFLQVLRGLEVGQRVEVEYWRAGQLSETALRLEGAALVYRRACEAGDAEACFSFGAMLTEGDSVVVNVPAAIKFLGRGCEGGAPAACVNLGIIYEHGTGDTPIRPQLAITSYERACSMGVMPGCFNLALYYRRHDATLEENERAAELFEQLCASDDAEACNEAAFIYRGRRGLIGDQQRSIALFRKACNLGQGRSCGVLERSLRDDLENQGKADEWARACDSGELEACDRLAQAHAFGEGIGKDLKRALVLAQLACNGRVRGACHRWRRYQGNVCTWEFVVGDTVFSDGSPAQSAEECAQDAREHVVAACEAEQATVVAHPSAAYTGGRGGISHLSVSPRCGGA